MNERTKDVPLVRDIMTPRVQWVHLYSTLQDAALAMKAMNVDVLPVIDGDRLVGIVTDRDLATRAAAEGVDPKEIRVNDVMSSDLMFCYDDHSLEEAAGIMEGGHVRHLPVLNRDKELVGIVSVTDIAARAGDERLAGEVVEHIAAHPKGRSKP